MKWQETTLRKGTKQPKICRDMFITSWDDSEYMFVEVRNGRIYSKYALSDERAAKLIRENSLTPEDSHIFRHAKTYRTETSNKVINNVLAVIGVSRNDH